MAWEKADAETRYFQWRVYFARRLLEEIVASGLADEDDDSTEEVISDVQ